MATVEKIHIDIEKTKEKISEQQKHLRFLKVQLAEEENLKIVRMIKKVLMDNEELTAFLKAYTNGLIVLPYEMSGMSEPEGNAALVDDFYGDKRLITVTTKADHYFYIFIGRADEDKGTTVHFLN